MNTNSTKRIPGPISDLQPIKPVPGPGVKREPTAPSKPGKPAPWIDALVHLLALCLVLFALALVASEAAKVSGPQF